ncbi:unnamed protein product [Allacma fusca]|uniref:J domain-containing protein n=1 Tax=Allacma fusca TaxID=39272 RepID=A0A8J2PMM2_9HEXA|nr:unnamed protein product [Allacma fusca]
MAKSVLVAYFLWFTGGWFGLHHFYLGRDRQAFVWWCLFAGYGGVGWLGDMFRIPKYVGEANMDEKYIESITERMRKTAKPPFSFYRFIGQIVFGNLLAWVTYRAVPEEPVYGYSLMWLHILIPLGSAIGAHTVGNIGREKAALVFRRYVEWNREPPKRRSLYKRITILGSCGMIYLSLWGSFLYFNMEMTNEHGEQIKFRESFYNLLKSPLWKELADSLGKLWQYYRIHGWKSLWNEILGQLDPMGERNALSVLDLPSSASQEEITQRWRQLSRKYHPDKFPDPEEKAAAQAKFMEIKEAYDKISVINSKRKRKSSRSTQD